MFGVMLFLHLAGLSIWIGSLLAIVLMLLLFKSQLGTGQTNQLAKRMLRTFNMLAHPSAIVVLISGVIMIVNLGLGKDKPLWLDVMEKGGGMIILLALILTGILGSKVKKQLHDETNRSVRMSGYLATTGTFVGLILAVVFVVSMKL